MSDLYQAIIKNSTLNKNVSTLVESYLLDPPVLPFLRELKIKTYILFVDSERYWSYQKYYINMSNGLIVEYCPTIVIVNERWSVTGLFVPRN